MAKRNYIQEILEIQTRTGEKPPYLNAYFRIREVRALIENDEKVPEEVFRYCPVGLVACMEAYFRSVVKELIDSGQPFQERCARFERINFSFETLAAIHGRTITLGDLVAHLIPINNKKDINSCMSVLLDSDFLEEIKNVRKHWPWKSINTASTEPIIADPASLFQNIDKTFELRHIVCHEFAHPIQISQEDAAKYTDSIELLLDATNFMTMKLLFRDVPETQQERNIYFGAKFKKANEKLAEILTQAEQVFTGKRLKDFKRLQTFWESYRDKDAEFVSSLYEGGTIRPQIHAQRLEYLTNQRIIEIKELMESEKP